MATCGGYSFERTILESIKLMELKNTVYTDLELAALLGETLRQATNSQEEEIARLKCLMEERNQELKREKSRCPSFASLEAIYGQPINHLDKEIAFLKNRNEECTTKIGKYRTLLECSADDQQSLSRVMNDLNTVKNDWTPSESSDHCILCTCASDKKTLYSVQQDQIHAQLAEMTNLQVRLQDELDNVAGDRQSIRDEIDVLARQVDCLYGIVMEVEEEHHKSKAGYYSEDEQKRQAGDDNSQWKEEERRKGSVMSTSCNTSLSTSRSSKYSPGEQEKSSGRFVNVVQSLMLKN